MTDNRTTELREKLDERGVEYEAEDMQTNMQTYWGDWCFMEPLDAKPHTLGAQCELMLIPATPEQAIAATLGSGTCHMSFIDDYETANGDEEYLCECSECGHRRWELAHDLPLFCPKCGAKVVER